MIAKAIGLSGALLAMAACADLRPEEKLSPPPVAQGVELTKQQGGRFIAFVGPRRQHTAAFLGVPDTNYYALRSWLDNKTGETVHQLYIADSYFGSPLKWDGVHDADHTTLKFIPIGRNEITCEEGCSYADEFAAELPEGYLRAHKGGLAVSFTASDGQILPVSVPADLVATQLTAIDAVRSTIATAANNSAPSDHPKAFDAPLAATPPSR